MFLQKLSRNMSADEAHSGQTADRSELGELPGRGNTGTKADMKGNLKRRR